MDDKRYNQVIESLFTYRKVDELQEYLQNNPDINIIRLTDSQGNNVLHQLAFQGHLQLIKVFIRKVKLKIKKRQFRRDKPSRDIDQKDLNHWLNQKNNEGFTPLLYAAYNGRMEVVKFFIQEHRVDCQSKTSTGLNILHLAAQKNMLMPFLYFRGKIDLYSFDDLKSTPLHWAAYTNSEQVVAYILAETDSFKCLNYRDEEGNTALMLAVSYGNTRIVRRLLIKGADRYIPNNEVKIPFQVAKQSEFKTISKMLDEKFSIIDMVKLYCNIKIEYRPKKRKYPIPLLFIVSFIVNLFIINFVLRFVQDYVLYTQAAFMALMFCFYISLLCQTPGIQPKSMQSILQEYSERTIKRICFICKTKIPKRGYHCDTCGVCIQQYDHHCTWINNCVGKKNIARFIFFITMLVVSLAFIGIVSVLATIALFSNNQDKFVEYFAFRIKVEKSWEKFCLLGCFLVNQLTATFFLPVLMLCLIQFRNLLTNKTTFEKLRGPSEDPQKIKSKMRKQGKISLRNCRVMCEDTRASFISSSSFSISDDVNQKYKISQSREINASGHS